MRAMRETGRMPAPCVSCVNAPPTNKYVDEIAVDSRTANDSTVPLNDGPALQPVLFQIARLPTGTPPALDRLPPTHSEAPNERIARTSGCAPPPSAIQAAPVHAATIVASTPATTLNEPPI